MIVNYKAKEIKLPDFLIVGAAKSGTTSLYYYLRHHSDIFMSFLKEPWFFSFVNSPPNYASPEPLHGVIWKLEDYIDLFKDSKSNQLMGEASPSYLYTYERTIKDIKNIYGENYKKLKIIIILRNPVERAFSQFMMFKRENMEQLDFKHALSLETIEARLKNNWNIFYDYIGFGLYFNQVNAFANEFPSLKILFYDDLVENQTLVLKELCEFLNIDFLNDLKLNRYNKSGIPRINYLNKLITEPSWLKNVVKIISSQEFRQKIKHKIFELNLKSAHMSKMEKGYLSVIFNDDVHNLSNLLNRDLTVWLV